MDGHTVLCVQVQTVVRGISHGVEAVVHGCLSHGCGILRCVGQIHHRLLVVELGSQVGREVHLHLVALLTATGGDDDHTVGSARSVDRGRGSVLQHLHRLDIVHVQSVQVSRCRHTVDDEEGILR